MKRKTEFNLPERHEPHTDKYFLRSSEILRKENINPFVRYQVFIRNGYKVVDGIDESIAAIMKYSPEFKENGGKIYALHDGDRYEPEETLMFIEGPVQDLIELETIYLSILSERTSKANKLPDPNMDAIRYPVKTIVETLDKSKFGPRPLSYFGARHYGYEWDAPICKVANEFGAVSASTDYGAEIFGQKGVGTVPHALVLTMAIEYGIEDSAVETMRAFDKHMPKDVPRVFLADTFNKEITDTLKVAEELDDFWGPRFDTNGAIVAEGGKKWGGFNAVPYHTGEGVKISGVNAARDAFDKAGYEDLKIALTSGFSNPEKVAAFIAAEEVKSRQLFDFIGAGFADNRYTATSDIMGYYNSDDFVELHKTGRSLRPNPKLKEVDLDAYIW